VSTTARRVRYREQRENTRLDIMEAAAGFLRERPFRELSVDAVMTRVGLTRTAFYRHFDDTTDLVLRLLEQLVEKLYPVAERWRESVGESYPSPAQQGLASIVDFFVAEGPLVRAIVDAAGVDDRIETAYRGVMETFIALTAQSLEGLVASGRLEPVDSLALARALTRMNQAYLLEEFGREPFGDRDVALAILERVWLGAIGPLRPEAAPGQ
jgi:AcrR family transcriptional regulator